MGAVQCRTDDNQHHNQQITTTNVSTNSRSSAQMNQSSNINDTDINDNKSNEININQIDPSETVSSVASTIILSTDPSEILCKHDIDTTMLKYITDIKDYMIENEINIDPNNSSSNPLSFVLSTHIQQLLNEYPPFSDVIATVSGNPAQILQSLYSGNVSLEYNEVIEKLHEELSANNRTGSIIAQTSTDPYSGSHFIETEIFKSVSTNKAVIINMESFESINNTVYSRRSAILDMFKLIVSAGDIDIVSVTAIGIIDVLNETLLKLDETTTQYKEMLIGELESVMDGSFPRYQLNELELDRKEYNINTFVKAVHEDWEYNELHHDKEAMSTRTSSRTGSQNMINSDNVDQYFDAISFDNQQKMEHYMRREQCCNLIETIGIQLQILYECREKSSLYDTSIISLFSTAQAVTQYIYDFENDLRGLIYQSRQIKNKLYGTFFANIWKMDDIDDQSECSAPPPPSKKTKLLCPLCQKGIGTRKILICNGCRTKLHEKCYKNEMKNNKIWCVLKFCVKCQEESNSGWGIILPSPL